MQRRREDLVSGDDEHAAPDVLSGWLARGRLDLVACREGWEEDVEEEVYEGREPEEEELDEEGAGEFNHLRGVGGGDGAGPGVGEEGGEFVHG